MTETAKLYGDGLYDLAAEEQLSDAILQDGKAVGDLFDAEPDYRRLLSEPSIPKTDRIRLLDEAFSGRIAGYLLNFLKILCEKGILSEYKGCMEEYEKRYNKDHGIITAVVTTAIKLSDEQAKTLREKLEAKSGKKVILDQVVSPSVIGGLRVEMEGELMDGTIKSQLSGMHRSLKNTVMAAE